MMRALIHLRRLLRDTRASTVIETAIVLPPLLSLAFGTYEVSRMIARQSELQNAANEAATIIQAAIPDTSAKITTMKSLVQASTGLNTNQVTLTTVYRCGSNSLSDFSSTCDNGQKVSTYLQLVLTDTYTPAWVQAGFGSSMNYRIVRQMQIS
jgi:Flp pilus assembly protein TadG